jgi:hypothetical protein
MAAASCALPLVVPELHPVCDSREARSEKRMHDRANEDCCCHEVEGFERRACAQEFEQPHTVERGVRCQWKGKVGHLWSVLVGSSTIPEPARSAKNIRQAQYNARLREVSR